MSFNTTINKIQIIEQIVVDSRLDAILIREISRTNDFYVDCDLGLGTNTMIYLIKLVFYMTEHKILEQKIKDPNGEIRFRKYMVGNFLGKGGFAKCYQATELQSKEEVAIKIINKQNLMKSRAKQKLLSEIKIHKTLIHPYIVRFRSVFEDQENVYIVLELCTGRSMSEMVKKRKNLTCQQTRYYLFQLLSALEYLHANKVIHRDLKMANIFLSENMEVKLGDFGLSAKLEFCDERKRTMAGTPNYIAPEIIDGTAGHSYEVDLWSTGVICYALLFGRPPFETSELKMTYNRIKSCQYNFPSNISVPNSARDFIKKTLVLDPKKRLTIAQMYQHPFLKGERPRSIPRYATDDVPVFQKQQLILQEQSTVANNISKILPPQSPRQNVLKNNSNQVNKLQSKSTSLSHSTKLGASVENRQQRKDKIITQVSKQKEKPKEAQKVNKIGFERSQKSLGTIVCGYVDYSTKYGLGYVLNNGHMGVYFNDSTILAIEQSTKNYFYLENPAHSDKFSAYTEPNLPTDHNFTKKKMLLQKFQVQLKEQQKIPIQNMVVSENNNNDHVFVKQWLKTKHAIMFRLSNKIFQVDFFDHSQILLKTETKQIKFKSKKGQEQYMMLSDALHEKQRDTELGRRIKYTKQILNSLKRDQNQNAPLSAKPQ